MHQCGQGTEQNLSGHAAEFEAAANKLHIITAMKEAYFILGDLLEITTGIDRRE